MLKHVRDLILYGDHVTWYYMNTQWHNSVLDAVLPFFRNQWTWVPLYFFLAMYMPAKYGRQGLKWCGLFVIAFALSDQVSAHLLKPIFHRLRPCNNPYLADIVHIIVPCGGGYSFPSSHASNHFTIGLFAASTLGKQVKWMWPAGIIWAVIVSFSQVYVGVHFPLDVTCGALLGTGIGLSMGRIFNLYHGLDRKVAVQ
jgi:membrane-associated phospholipid phosphatase